MRLIRLMLLPVLLIAQLALIANPGYSSHDELEFLARADVPWSALPWFPWFDVSPLQYRPLALNLWLVLAHAVGKTPWQMHLAVVVLGTANAWLLARVLRAADVTGRVAFAAAVVFVLSPFVAYVHGWTGTLADLLTLAFGLIAARCIQLAAAASSGTTAAAYALACATAVGLALLSKESAIVLPALLLLVALRDIAQGAVRLAIALGAALVLAYLVVRLPVLANSAVLDPAYAWSLRHVPARLVEYVLYPFMPPLFEVAPLLSKSTARIAAAAGCVVLMLGALSTAGWRWPLAWLASFCAALAPVLVLAISYNQYAYLASASAIAISAAAWSRLAPRARTTLLALAAIVVLHGIIVMGRLHGVGVVQRNLCGDLVANLAQAPGTLRILAADPSDAWLPRRLLNGVVAWRGVPFDGRVRFDDAPADRLLWMDRDGHLHPGGTPLTPH